VECVSIISNFYSIIAVLGWLYKLQIKPVNQQKILKMKKLSKCACRKTGRLLFIFNIVIEAL